MSTLENDHNVYILGAGFSADRGLPTMKDFMVTMRDAHHWLVENGRKSEADAIQKVLAYRLKATSAGYRVSIELENIEDLFSLAAASRDNLSNDIRVAIAATLDYCLNTQSSKKLQSTTLINNDKFHRYSIFTQGYSSPQISVPSYEYYIGSLIGWFGSEAVIGKNTFISFNYDTLVEDSLSSLGVDFSYGLKLQNTIVNETASALRLRDDAEIKVLKLHGSINWARTRQSRKLSLFGSYSDVRTHGLIPEIVPPTWRKIFGEQLNDVWTEALVALESATRIIILGFSMPVTDLHFKYLLAAGLQDNLSLRQIVAVNPDKDAIEQRLSEIMLKSPHDFERWVVTGTSISDFIGPRNDKIGLAGYGRPVSVQGHHF